MTTRKLITYSEGFFRAQRWWPVLVMIFFATVGLPSSGQAIEFQKCTGCHEASLDKAQYREYLHSPFALQQCGECHAATETPLLEQKSLEKSRAAKRGNQKKIDWLGDSAMLASSHSFVLPSDKVGERLVIEEQRLAGEFSRQEIEVPFLFELAEVKDSGHQPIISDVLVLSVQRGIFLSATIGWQTDTLTTAQVRYGNSDLSQTSELSPRFGRRHQVVLHKLKPDKTYRFAAVATDLFGRARTSEPLTFSTSKPMEKKREPEAGNPSVNGDQGAMKHQFWRLGADYLVELTLGQPAAVFVGSKGEARKQQEPEASAAVPQNEESHAGLSSEIVITMGACSKCHKNQNTATHPVNVYPKPGMTIPPEFPTLPDGRITCGTCHDTHSSDNEYLGRKPSKRELCTGCHQDML